LAYFVPKFGKRIKETNGSKPQKRQRINPVYQRHYRVEAQFYFTEGGKGMMDYLYSALRLLEDFWLLWVIIAVAAFDLLTEKEKEVEK
jgi:hypothetical protein